MRTRSEGLSFVPRRSRPAFGAPTESDTLERISAGVIGGAAGGAEATSCGASITEAATTRNPVAKRNRTSRRYKEV